MADNIKTDSEIIDWIASQEVFDGGFHTDDDPDTGGINVAQYAIQNGISIESALREVVSKVIHYESNKDSADSGNLESNVDILDDSKLVDWIAKSDIINGAFVDEDTDNEAIISVEQYAIENQVSLVDSFRKVMSIVIDMSENSDTDEDNEKFLDDVLNKAGISLDEILN